MKKLAITLIAFLACFQSAHAATSALTESLFEIDAIIHYIGDPSFNGIPVTEFITEIKRITKEVDVTGTVKYKIITRVLSESKEVDLEAKCGCSCNKRTHVYIATLEVTPNTGIGPNQVTVISITPAERRSTFFFVDVDTADLE